MSGASTGTEWVLGFDGGCGDCNDLAWRIVALAEGRVTAQSLNSSQVSAWREKAFGADAPWAPTLFAVEPDGVRAWIGPRLALRLAQLVGPAATLSVLQTLRDLNAAHQLDDVDDPSRRRAIEMVGKTAGALGLLAFDRGAWPAAVGAQGKNATDLSEVRLEIATPREQAKLGQNKDAGPQERAFVDWLDREGYRPAEGGRREHYLVYRKNRMAGRVDGTSWQGRDNRGAVILSLSQGSQEKWVGYTFDGGRGEQELTYRRGSVQTARFNQDRSVTAAGRGDSLVCDSCEVSCALAFTGGTVAGQFTCWLRCGGIAAATAGLALGICASICIASGIGGAITGPAGCPGLCEDFNFCPER